MPLPTDDSKTIKEYLTSISAKGQITLPAEIRNRLGLKPKDKVAILLEQEAVVLRPAYASLEAGFQSIPALRPHRDLEEMTEIAAEEHADEAAREGLPRHDGSS
jgi:antitoxin PrlF